VNYLSVCSGVEAATVAWHDLGWKAVAYSEIEKFPSEVLAHHYPTVPNMGDMTKYKEWNFNESINLLVGGTPCQSFSVAGLRKGLEDPRGNLALTYIGLLDKFRPKWCIWENVPGVLSSNGGRDFGSFLGALVECGYGFAYRVLDAQNFGVPQRRRRVFVVGCLGDWESPAKVLFERESLCGDTKKSRKAGKEITGYTPTSFGSYGEGVGTLRNAGGDLGGGSETLVFDRQSSGEYGTQDIASTISARDYKSATDLVTVYETHPADSRVKEMGNVCQTVTSRWGTGGGNVPIAVQDITGRDKAQNGKGWNDDGIAYTVDTHATQGVWWDGRDQTAALTTRCHDQFMPDKGNFAAVLQAYSIREDAKANNFSATPLEVTPALQALRPSVQSHHAQTFIAGMAVRRLTPIECERLQGFPDNYTNIPWKGKDAPDSARYKAMGNSMAVPVMAWIGKRINEVENEL
jgi:DNA (cytosine-5)-methyltransferase 1